MKLPPAVIVHELEQARTALRAGLPVTLLSAPAAACYAGVGWWLALMRAASEQPPPHILDCGESPARALEALRAGQRLVALRAPPALFEDIAARAHMLGATMLPAPPPALDLSERTAARRLRSWLGDVPAPPGDTSPAG